jgi:hypothetical protein
MPLAVSKKILCEIGQITVWQSRLEAQMALFLRELPNDPGATKLPARPSHHDLSRVLKDRLNRKYGSRHPYVLQLAEIAKKIEDVVSRRNKVVHSMWSFGPEFDPTIGTRFSTTDPPQSRIDYVEVSVADLEEISLEFECVEFAVSDLRVRSCNPHYSGTTPK